MIIPRSTIRRLIIRLPTLDEIPQLISLERQCEGASHWSEEQYREMFAPESNRLMLVSESVNQTAGESEAGITGFLVARHVAPEWELENVAVASTARRGGVGNELLKAFLTRARENNSQSVFLEVRESNLAARGLYEKAGFARTGRRKAYYSDPLEDAIVYSLRL